MKNTIYTKIQLKPIIDNDLPFLYKVYRDIRLNELKPANFSSKELEDFLQMQFKLQHTQYMQNYTNPSFDIIIYDSIPVGRLYVDRKENEIRIIDIALLTQYRRKGIGQNLIKELINEANLKKVPLSLHVEHENPIMKYYNKLGFEAVQDRGVYLFMIKQPK